MKRQCQSKIKEYEKRNIGFTLTPTRRGVGGEGGCYFAHVRHNQIIREEQVIQDLASHTYPHLPESAVKMLLARLGEYAVEQLRHGHHLQLGPFNVGFAISGKFDAANAPFDPAKHRLAVVVSPRIELKNAVAYLRPTNKTQAKPTAGR